MKCVLIFFNFVLLTALSTVYIMLHVERCCWFAVVGGHLGRVDGRELLPGGTPVALQRIDDQLGHVLLLMTPLAMRSSVKMASPVEGSDLRPPGRIMVQSRLV